MTVLRSGSASDVGRVRSINEDLALEGATLFAVADGMGGHAGGEVAARTAIDSLRSSFEHAPTVDGLVEAVHEANQAVWDKGHADPSLRGMGTTLIAAALVGTEEGDRLVVTNVGDSRAYRLHGGDLGQLSVDHSVAEELVARGELSEREAAVHPHRHILTRALGVDSDVDVDVWELVPEEGDRFLLCSDGLSNEVAPEDIERVLTEKRDPQEAAEALVGIANERGGSDNITAVVLDVLVGEASTGDGATDAAAAILPGSAPTGNGTDVLARTDELAGRDAASKTATRQPPPPRRAHQRRVTLRVLLFLLVLGGLAYGAWRVVEWYVDSSYFVALDSGHVAIFQGRRGGFLGMHPKVINSYYGLTSSQLSSVTETQLASGVEEPSRPAASNYVANLWQSLCEQVPPPSGLTCPPPITPVTTTVPPSKAAGGRVARGCRLLLPGYKDGFS